MSYESQLNTAHEQTEQFSIDLETKEHDLQNLQEQMSIMQNKLREEAQKVYNVLFNFIDNLFSFSIHTVGGRTSPWRNHPPL